VAGEKESRIIEKYWSSRRRGRTRARRDGFRPFQTPNNTRETVCLKGIRGNSDFKTLRKLAAKLEGERLASLGDKNPPSTREEREYNIFPEGGPLSSEETQWGKERC